MLALRDAKLIQIVDAAVAESVRRSGAWVICGPGCAECCHGPFDISPLDALRLQEGLAQLQASDPARAAAVASRAADYVETEDSACPALDPVTRCCDLYPFRPITCRAFGPATYTGDAGVATCELNYQGASDEQIEACAVEIDPDGVEARLIAELSLAGQWSVAAALRRRDVTGCTQSPER